MQAQNGKRVKVEFVGRLEDGTVFGAASKEKPLEFTLGKGEIIPGFEEAVLGMEPGQDKVVKLEPERAFGPYDESKKVSITRDQFPDDVPLEIGRNVEVQQSTGQRVAARVESIADASVTLNLNHPLAGKNLDFQIRLLEVV